MVDRVRPLFPLGQCVATPGALAALEEAGQTPADFLNRHVCGDWGEIHPADKGMNEQALKDGARIFSVYRTSKEQRFGSSPRPIALRPASCFPTNTELEWRGHRLEGVKLDPMLEAV